MNKCLLLIVVTTIGCTPQYMYELENLQEDKKTCAELKVETDKLEPIAFFPSFMQKKIDKCKEQGFWK